MSLVVRKSSPMVVRPSPEQVTMRGTIKLSSFDMSLNNVPQTLLLVFEHPIHNAAGTIQAALSRALAHYYPIAGRVVVARGSGDGDDVYIECNDEGVSFVAASTDHALKEVICFDRSPDARKLLDELVLYYPAMAACGPRDPLLMVQVTKFSCGGFVLGVTWNHGVADGAGMGQILQAVGELAGGLPSPSVAPVRWDGSLQRLPPSILEEQEHMLNLDPLNGDLATLDITIPFESIDQIRSDFSGRFHGQPCTTFEAVLAVLWRCRTRAIRLDPETPVLLMFVADVRKHVGAKKGYYGNCIIDQFVVAKSGAVADGDVKDVIMAIKHAKDQIPCRLKMMGQQELCKVPTYHMMMASSWRNLGFDRVDFGSGTPARVTASGKDMPPAPAVQGFLCSGRDGVSLLSALVTEEHTDALLAELAKFMSNLP